MTPKQFHALCGTILLSGAFTADSQVLFAFACLAFVLSFLPPKYTDD